MLLAFIKKETLHVLRDRRMLLVVLLIPVVQMLLFGFAIKTEVNEVRTYAALHEQNEPIRRMCERLKANPYVTFEGCVPPAEAYGLLRGGKADAVVVFRSADDIQILADASNPNMAQTSAQYLQEILTTDATQGASASLSSLITTRFLYNPRLESSFNFVPGIMGMLFLLVCALMTAVSIVREKETGTMELLLCSPTRPWQIIVAKMVPFFVLSCLDLLLILLIARHVLDVPLTAGVLPVVVISVIYIILSLSLGLFVSTVSTSQVMAMLLSGMVMILPVVMLSGLLFPTENLPVVLREVSYIIPARWYIDAMRKVMIEGLGFFDVWQDTAILLLTTAIILAAGIRNFKDTLE